MKRRSFLEMVPAVGAGLFLSPKFTFSSESKKGNVNNIPLKIVKSSTLELLPEGKRLAFGWPAIGLVPGESIIVKPQNKLVEENLWIRVSVAQQIRDEKLLHVSIHGTDFYLGAIDLRFSSVLVPCELEISGEYAKQINQHGLELKLESSSPFWFFSEKAKDVDNSVFLPHILSSTEKTGTIDRFFECYTSVNSVQAFGWREGTVLDGLWQLYAQKGNKKALSAIKQQFGLFFEGKNLTYEDGYDNPKHNYVRGTELTLPFATLGRLDASHPILKTVVDGWKELEQEQENGAVIDGFKYTAEGCYTVAYPMAVIGKSWKDMKLQKDALSQLTRRFVLINDGKLYLRYYPGSGKYTYPNWARGAAWTLLGFVRTMSELKDEIQDQAIIEKFQEGTKIALSMQRENGLWGCFMHDKKSLPDTSGSAGISAAILIGIKNEFLPPNYRIHAVKCWEALQNYITPDGFLKGVAQDNRGGIALQESDYRVIAQMGMGLMAQLYAEL